MITSPNPLGWEYPPGISAKDIDDHFGEPPLDEEPSAEYDIDDQLEPRPDRQYEEPV